MLEKMQQFISGFWSRCTYSVHAKAEHMYCIIASVNPYFSWPLSIIYDTQFQTLKTVF